jgi:RNA polymerase sigma-70 factor (ECF subfamily)
VLAQRDELERALDRAIAALPEKQRLAVVMRRFQETPYEELCEVLGMSLPAVKSLLFRARAELRKSLAAYLGEEPEG